MNRREKNEKEERDRGWERVGGKGIITRKEILKKEEIKGEGEERERERERKKKRRRGD